MFVQKNFLLLVIGLSVVFAVAMKATIYQKDPVPPPPPVPAESAEFRAYWQTGVTEQNTYSWQQTRPGTVDSGTAVLRFTPEAFRPDAQVSIAAPADEPTVPVLTTTIYRTFCMGQADYALVTSVFTPINQPSFPSTLKASSSLQSGAGMAYSQLNLRNNGYRVLSHSYAEADADYRIDKTLLEDELYNRIRLNPAKLPTGDVRLVPGMASVQLRHKKPEPQTATVMLTAIAAPAWSGALISHPTDSVQAYTVDYPNDARKLMIVFDKAFPHRIVGWEETYTDAGQRITSKAVLTKTIRSDYAKHRTPADTTLRNELLP